MHEHSVWFIYGNQMLVGLTLDREYHYLTKGRTSERINYKSLL